MRFVDVQNKEDMQNKKDILRDWGSYLLNVRAPSTDEIWDHNGKQF